MTGAVLDPPEPAIVVEVPLDDGEAIQLRFHPNPGRPVLALSHGNGFAIDAYAPLWAPLRDDFALCLFDVRHHGWNAPQNPARTGIERYAADLGSIYAAIRELAPGAPLIGAFHSLSAIASLHHAATGPAPPDALILFDPPIQPPAGHPLHDRARAFELKLAEWSGARPDRFGSPEQLAERFARSRSLSGWIDGAHLLMARSILREVADGDWRLRCPPAVEAQNYRDNAALTSWNLFERVEAPVAMVCGDPDHPAGQSPAQVCAALAHAFPVGYARIEGTTHMLQIERPEECRAALRMLVEDLGVLRLAAG